MVALVRQAEGRVNGYFPGVHVPGLQVQALSSSGLVLRDIHQPAAQPWWPPAPGWWLLLAVVLVVAALATAWGLRRRRRRVAAARLFDQRSAAAQTPAARIAVISELLRRAARIGDPLADRLQGDAWLEFLDGDRSRASPAHRPFSQGPGRVLLEGGFRRVMDADDADTLLPIARKRYLELMAARR